MLTNHDIILGTLSSGERVPLLQADRRRHVYVIGMTGTGKTGLLLNLMHADLLAGAGFCFLDPHGDASQHIASLAPARAPVGRDLSRPVRPDPHLRLQSPIGRRRGRARDRRREHRLGIQKHLGAQLGAAPRIHPRPLRCACCSTRKRSDACSGFPACLVDDDYRDWLVRRCQDPVVRSFWLTEYAAYDSRFRNEAIAPIQNKVGAFLANPFIRSILCQNSSTLKIPDVMNNGKVLIVNLSKGNLGTEPAHLLGALLITACSQAAEARRHMPEHERRDFTLYVDEFQNFATESFASILSEARKWRLSLVAANQHDLAVARRPATRRLRQRRNARRLSRRRARRQASCRRARHEQSGDVDADEQLPSLDQAHARRRADGAARDRDVRSPAAGRALGEGRRLRACDRT